MSSPIPKSYKILPHIRILKVGTLIQPKIDIYGSNAPGLTEDDPNYEYGGEERFIPAGENCMFLAEEQFMAFSPDKPMSAWVRLKLLHNEQIVWHTLLQVQKRVWDFKPFPFKKKMIQEAFDEQFVYTTPSK